MTVFVAGINIKQAPLEMLERLSVHHSQNTECVGRFKESCGLSGAVVLSTCNRLEFYGSCDDDKEYLDCVFGFITGRNSIENPAYSDDLMDSMYVYEGSRAVRHLFEVVCGLDSLIVGEYEVAGQVSRAYKCSCQAQANDKMINKLFQRALQLGKKVRSETRISRYSTSVGRIAVDIAERELGGIQDKNVLICGAGEMSQLTMKYLVDRKVSIAMVSNRSLAKAQELADQYGFGACSLDEMGSCLEHADVVFSATNSKTPLITCEKLREVMPNRASARLLCIDMAVPRDIEPGVADIEGVSYFDIGELRDVADRHWHERLRAAHSAAAFIDEAVDDFARWNASLKYIPTIDALYSMVDRIKEDKLERAMSKLSGLSDKQKNVVQCLATSIAHQMVHEPVSSLNAMAGTEKSRDYALALQELFGLDAQVGSASQGADASKTSVRTAP